MTNISTLTWEKLQLWHEQLVNHFILQQHSHLDTNVFLPPFLNYLPDPIIFTFPGSNYQQNQKCFGPSTTTTLLPPLTKNKKKCPNDKEGTPANNKDNLTVMLSVIFRIRQCGLSFLIWFSLSKQHYNLCLCCFVAFGYLPNAPNKSGLIS